MSRPEENKDGMVWESDKLVNRYPCAECQASDCYTRIYENREIPDARFLCYNCACDYVEKKGYRELVLPFLKSSDVLASPCEPFIEEVE